MNSKQWKLLIYLLIGSIGLNIAHPATPALVEYRNFNSSIFGLLFAFMSGGFLIGTILWGTWSDRIQKKYLATIPFGLFYGGGQYLMGVATTEEMILIARIISGFGAAAFFTATPTLIAAYSDKNKSQAQTYMIVFMAAGNGIGYLLGGTINELIDVTTAITIQALLVGSVSLLALFTLSKAENEKSSLPYFKQLAKGLKGIKKESLLLFFIAMLPFFAVKQTMGKWIDVYAVSDKYAGTLGVNTIYLGAYVAATGIVTLIFTMVFGKKIINKFNDYSIVKLTIFGCTGLIIMSGLLIEYVDYGWVLPVNIASSITITLLWSLSNGAMSAIITNKFKKEAGTVIGIQQFIRQGGSIIASLAAGVLLVATSFGTLFIAYGIVMFTALFFVLMQKEKAK